VRRLAGGEDARSRRGGPALVAELEGELALEDVERLVELGMNMEGRPGEVGGDAILHDGEPAFGLLAAEPNVDRVGRIGHLTRSLA
jgi:hypothetical protein